jgi:hypothetical protein
MYPLVPDAQGRAENDKGLRRELRQFVEEGLAAGAEARRIREKLEIAGYSEELAKRVVDEMAEVSQTPTAPQSETRRRGFRNILLGALLLIACTGFGYATPPGPLSIVFGIGGLIGLGMIGLGMLDAQKKS